MRSLIGLLFFTVILLNVPVSDAYAAEAEINYSNAIILVYQRIGERRHSKYVSEATFSTHLDYLNNNGFNIWPLERVVRRLRTGQPIPPKTVAITFDGTHPSIYKYAYPKLKAKGWPFTLFVVPDKVDQIPRGNISWEEMREMQQHGASYANNSMNHIHMIRPLRGYPPRAWVHYVRDNILNAQDRLQEELGDKTNQQRLFAYPYGEYSIALANILAEIGFTSFGQQPGVVSKYSDMRALPRFLMQRNNSGIESFARKVNSIALPVQKRTPWNPLTGTGRPKSSITLDSKAPAPRYLSCYTRDGKRVDVKWGNKQHSRFELSVKTSLPRGYNYYQCTSKLNGSQQYYWFSQPWVVSKRKQQVRKTPEEQEAEEQAKDLKDVTEANKPPLTDETGPAPASTDNTTPLQSEAGTGAETSPEPATTPQPAAAE